MHDIGLVINPLFSFFFLDATSDARLHVYENSVTGILEIKYPYSMRDMSMDEACENQFFFL